MFFSVILAGFVAWKSIGTSSEASDSFFSEDSEDLKASTNDQEKHNMTKV